MIRNDQSGNAEKAAHFAEQSRHFAEQSRQANAAIARVRAVHVPIDALNVRANVEQKVCTGCGTDDGNWQTWPCPTERAITEATS